MTLRSHRYDDGGANGSFLGGKHRGRLPRANAPVDEFFSVANSRATRATLDHLRPLGAALMWNLRETVSFAPPTLKNTDNLIANIAPAGDFAPPARDMSCEPADRMLEFLNG